MDDALPAGAGTGSTGNDSWSWISSNPAPQSGSKAHQSSLNAGLHGHSFNWTAPFTVNAGESLYTYVYLDPANPPSEIMLSWNKVPGDWEHRAYWGANNINYGTDGTASRRYMGALPAAGQWVRLEVPASAVDLEGASLQGMDFSIFNGRATWDSTGTMAGSGSGGSSTPTNNPTPTNSPSTATNLPANDDYDFGAPQMPLIGQNFLRIITPTLLELHLVNTAPAGGSVTSWNFVNSSGSLQLPATSQFTVTANNSTIGVQSVGFKRRPLYAPLAERDLRIDNCLYLQLSSPIPDNATVKVVNPNGSLWSSSLSFTSKAEALRYNPAIHVNQEGYVPAFPKKAMVGYYLGSMGELPLPSTTFTIVNATSGVPVWQGSLTPRADVGYSYTPTPYQKVYQADFSTFTTPGEYRLVVPGLGASLPFLIDEGIAMSFARAYGLGLYHQRCGTANSMPYTRFTHDACHTAEAAVPLPQSSYNFTWNKIGDYAQQSNADNPAQTAPKLTSPSAQLYPFARTGTIDTSGGHHDAGDYSKYTINCASLTHALMFSVDSLAGVAALDNLGIPESGDGISDILQEAKWEADFLTKIQDSDGGFYFLVYPKDREYENNVTPDHGDAQVVWPKTTSATAAAVAALAQCASSPLMKQKYPQAAALYLEKAKLGWQFLQNAISKNGKAGAYQKITHYGDDFAHDDELAWAACEMFLATGDANIHNTLKSWFPDPTNASTFRWGWWRLYAAYGNAVRSYAFAVKSGRMSANQVDSSYLAKCIATVTAAGDDALKWSQQGAYGSSFPEATKRVKGAGWYFSASQAFDIAAAYQFNARADYLDAMVANVNYEGGCNPVNAAYVTGLGWKRQREIVHQYSWNDRRTMPLTGIPIASIQQGFVYTGTYGTQLASLTYPSDDASTALYPFYDRWGDTFNVTTEFVVTDQARGLGTVAFLAGMTSLKSQAWKPIAGQIAGVAAQVTAGTPVTATLQVPGMDLRGARILWEAKGQEPAYGDSFTFTPTSASGNWVEAEVQWPDGRRVFAATDVAPTGGGSGTNGLPAVSVTSTDSVMTEGDSSDTARFVINRTGSTANALTVTFQPGGAATKWNDYRRPQGDMPETFTIPAGQSTLEVTVYAPADSETEGNETGTFTIVGNPAYTIGTPASVTLTILEAGASNDNTPPTVSISSPANHTTVSGSTLTVSANASDNTAVAGVQFKLNGANLGSEIVKAPYALSVTNLSNGTYSLTAVARDPAGNRKAAPAISITVINGQWSGGGDTTGFRASLVRNSDGATVIWPSTPGKTYRVSYKNSVSGTNWTEISTNVTATGPSTSWSDPGAKTAPQRFYRVRQTN
ncbi:MAG TPA: glycoside hydrolase family 9 protein [Verrucomicrobiae bacterium]|nr:glycoside hydrolase family 9 protein [Verrucomicrobiae bacterium]